MNNLIVIGFYGIIVVLLILAFYFRTDVYAWIWGDYVRQTLCENFKPEYLKIDCGK